MESCFGLYGMNRMGRMVTTSRSLFFLLLLLLLFFCVALAALLPIAAAAEHDAVVKRLQEYLRIQTVHPDPDYTLVSVFLLSQATSVGLEARRLEFVKEKPVVLLSWDGTHPSLPSLLLNSHTDVVPAQKEKWIYHPFSATQVHMMLRQLATVEIPSTVSEYSKEEKLDLPSLEDHGVILLLLCYEADFRFKSSDFWLCQVLLLT
jgi:hypothetical protein